MVTAKILAIIAVILSALLTLKQQKTGSTEAARPSAAEAADANFHFNYSDVNKILESYGR